MTDESKTDETEEEEAGSTAIATETSADEDEEKKDSEGFEFAEDPEFDIDYKGDCAYEVKVSIAPANKKKQAGELFDELKQEAELPGFRRGRAPRKLIEKKFSKVVRADVEGKLVGAAFEKLVKDEDLKAIGFPDIDGLDDDVVRKDDEALEFTFKFEVSPRVELGKYRGIEVERPVIKIDEKDVDESIDGMRARHAIYEDLEGGVAAHEDQVVIDFNGTIDGEAFSGGSAENYPYVLGSQRFFPEFEKVLLGTSPGDDLSCDVVFPDDYFSEDLRGKSAKFTIKVNEVKRQSVPELTDEFAKEVGSEDVATMRQEIRDRLVQASESQSIQIAESRALNAVVEASTFEIPKSMIERLSENYRESEVRRLTEARVPAAIIEERSEEIALEAQKAALGNIKTYVALNEITEAEGIEVTDEDFEKEAESISKVTGAALEMVSQYLAQKEQRNSYVDRIYRAKAMAVIMENAKVTDKEMTRDEMDEEADATEETTEES